MIAAAGVLLLTSLLSQAQVQSSGSPTPVRGTDLIGAASPSAAAQSVDPNEGAPSAPTERQHEAGVGMGFGTGGGGLSFRFFFNDRLGVNLAGGWAHAPNSSQGYTAYVAPSVVYMLTKSKKLADIDVRPYVGGGLNFSNSSAPVQTTRTNVSSGSSGLGMQVYGGVEVTFQDVKSLAISAEVTHYELAATGYSTATMQGTNFLMMFHYYMK